MLHIVFSKEDAEALSSSFELDESLKGDVFIVEEDWSIGPLMGTINSDGETRTRNEWIAGVFKVQQEALSPVEAVKKILNADTEMNGWIWIAPNVRDVCGYYELVSGLKDFGGRLFALWLNNLPFINDKGQIFYPDYLNEIPAKEFVKAKILKQQITPAIFETDPDEWVKLRRENKMLRVLEGAKKIVGKEETYYDKALLNWVKNDWLKSARVIQQTQNSHKGASNKTFLLWRLRELIQKNVLEAKGDWPSSENFEIKKASSETNTDNA